MTQDGASDLHSKSASPALSNVADSTLYPKQPFCRAAQAVPFKGIRHTPPPLSPPPERHNVRGGATARKRCLIPPVPAASGAAWTRGLSEGPVAQGTGETT